MQVRNMISEGNRIKKMKLPSSISLTVITGQNIANRNNGNVQTVDLQIPESNHLNVGDHSIDENGGRYFSEEKDNREKVEKEVEGEGEGEGNDVSESTNSKSYTLTEEVQRVLIEDFFPPISSSTVPGNAGRLIITLSTTEAEN